VWSAIRKDCCTKLYGVADRLSLAALQGLVEALTRVALAPDGKEVYWKEKEGALLGCAAVLKAFRRLQVHRGTTPSAMGSRAGSASGAVFHGSGFADGLSPEVLRGSGSGSGSARAGTTTPGLSLGGVPYTCLPAGLVVSVKRCALPLLAHTQLSVREAAVQLLGTYLSRSGPAQVTCALEDLLDVLGGEVRLEAFATQAAEVGSATSQGCEGPVGSSGDGTTPRPHTPLAIATTTATEAGTLDPFAAEGVLSLLVVVLRLATPREIMDRWSALQPLVFAYLDHPASTARQAASKALLQVVHTCGRGWTPGDATATALVRAHQSICARTIHPTPIWLPGVFILPRIAVCALACCPHNPLAL
jgi:hypothetical protein